jgi:hypothetical protein
MSIVALLELRPREPSTGTVVVRRFAWNVRVRARFFGEDWEPAIVRLPTFETSLGFDGRLFGQGAIPQVGQAEIAVGRDDPMLALAWAGAEVLLRWAPWPETGLADPADGDFTAVMPLRVEEMTVDGELLRLSLIDAGRALRRPALARRFGSSGTPLLDGADTVDRHGQPVPNGWGRVRSVPGILVDRAHNIWLFLDRAATSVEGFFDGGAAFTLGVSRASLAALQSNTPAAGAVDYALNASGLTLARPWTTPQYPFTADLTAGDTRPAEIASAIVSARTSLAFKAGAIAAFNTAQSAVSGLYLDDERDVAAALDSVFAGLGSWWKLTSVGQIDIGQFAFAAPAITFGETELVEAERERQVMPTRRRGVGWRRNNRVHGESDIALILLTRRRFIYRRAATQPATPTGNDLPSGWADAPPGGSDPLWESSAEQTGAGLTQGSWSEPIRKEGLDGPGGLSSAAVFIYQRAATAPAAPTATATYTFATGALSGLNNGWSATVPAANGQPLWVRQASASGTGATDTIAPGEWSGGQKLAEDGAPGADGISRVEAAPFVVAAFANGNVKSGQLPQTRQLGLRQGTADLTGSASWSVLSQTNLTLSVSSAGVVTLSAISADSGSGTIRATLSAVTYDFLITARKIRDGAAPLSVSAALSFPATSTITTIGTTPDLALPANIPAEVSMQASWESTGGTCTGTFRLQYSTDGGGSWITMGGDEQASAIPAEPAFIAASRSLSSGSSARLVRFRAQASITNAGNVANASISNLFAGASA